MAEQSQDPHQKKPLKIRVPEEVAAGVYANTMAVFHTREEFVLDFVNVIPPRGVVTSRVITSPGHVKRIIRALQDNMERYEKLHGVVEEAPPPPLTGPTGYA